MTSAFSDIVCTEHTLSGSPRIDGRRLAVGDVVFSVEDCGAPLQQVVQDYELTIDQIKQALSYCATLQCKSDNPLVFCHNCSLSRPQERMVDMAGLEEIADENSVFVKGDNFVFLGSMEEFLYDWRGQDWWVIATDLLIDLRNELSDELSPPLLP